MSEPLFRPEVLEARGSARMGRVLIHQPLGYTLTALMAGALIAIAVAYAYFGTYTRKATVRGLLMPEQGLFRLVAPSGGQIAAVKAREGQQVEADQALFTLTTAQVTSSGPTHLLVRDQLQQRLELARSSAAYSRERQARDLELTVRRLDALDVEFAQIERELVLIARREELAQIQRERIRRQAESGFVSQAQLEQAESDLLTIRQQKHAVQRTRSTLERDRATLFAAQEEIKARHQAQSTEAETTLAILRQELAELDARRELISTAPFSGMVTGVHVHEGSIVSAGALLASIIPDTAKLVAHLYASEQKSGFLEVGQQVRIRYAAFPYQKYGMANGTVVSVAQSPYALAELPQHVAMAVQSETSGPALYYRVTVELDNQAISTEGRENPLRAGMVLEADIVQDARRLYEWALEPIYSVTGKLITRNTEPEK
ncbi:HlyD family secretion protein [Thauera sp.]|uniref:HlyD family secretion protein n=1 Tax=Thauera sp. TaxID=1905334 RepID=UPI0039E66F89